MIIIYLNKKNWFHGKLQYDSFFHLNSWIICVLLFFFSSTDLNKNNNSVSFFRMSSRCQFSFLLSHIQFSSPLFFLCLFFVHSRFFKWERVKSAFLSWNVSKCITCDKNEPNEFERFYVCTRIFFNNDKSSAIKKRSEMKNTAEI